MNMGVLIFTLLMAPLFSNFNARVETPLDSKIILVSKNEGLLRLLEKKDSSYKVISEYFVSYGQANGSKLRKDDDKTPTGVYFATSIMTRSEVPDEKYGAAAIPLNYPNPIDQSINKTGEGIWIHGTDNIERLSNKTTTKGCVILENKDLLYLINKIRPYKTPVIISNEFKDVKLIPSSADMVSIVVRDGSLKYKVTSTGLDKTSILYEKI